MRIFLFALFLRRISFVQLEVRIYIVVLTHPVWFNSAW